MEKFIKNALQNLTYDRRQQYVGEQVFEGTSQKEIRHEYGRVLADAGNRYQYYLTDHLGNTRVVLQEDPANFTVLATFEPDNLETESMQFMDYGEAPHIASSLFDHTGTSDTGYALRLTNGETGPSRSVAVLPGGPSLKKMSCGTPESFRDSEEPGRGC
jgi:hypothetical protein